MKELNSNSSTRNNDDSQNTIDKIVREIVKVVLDLYEQYNRTRNEAASYWEEEIKAGLSSGKYIDDIDDRQYLRIKKFLIE